MFLLHHINGNSQEFLLVNPPFFSLLWYLFLSDACISHNVMVNTITSTEGFCWAPRQTAECEPLGRPPLETRGPVWGPPPLLPYAGEGLSTIVQTFAHSLAKAPVPVLSGFISIDPTLPPTLPPGTATQHCWSHPCTHTYSRVKHIIVRRRKKKKTGMKSPQIIVFETADSNIHNGAKTERKAKSSKIFLYDSTRFPVGHRGGVALRWPRFDRDIFLL